MKPQTKQVCWDPALSNPSETPSWLAHTCVGKLRNGREDQTWEIYAADWVIVVKTNRLLSSWTAGVAGCGGKLHMDGWEPADLHAHDNFIIVNNRITLMVWLKHLYGLQ